MEKSLFFLRLNGKSQVVDHKFKIYGLVAASLCLFVALIQSNLEVPSKPEPPLQMGTEKPTTKFQLSVNLFGKKMRYNWDSQKASDPNELEQYHQRLAKYQQQQSKYEIQLANYRRKQNLCRILIWSCGLVAFLLVTIAWSKESKGWLTTGIFLLTVFGLFFNLLLIALSNNLFLLSLIAFLFIGGGELLIWGIYLLFRLSFNEN